MLKHCFNDPSYILWYLRLKHLNFGKLKLYLSEKWLKDNPY